MAKTGAIFKVKKNILTTRPAYHAIIFFLLFFPYILFGKDQNYGGNFNAMIAQSGNLEQMSVYVNQITFSCDIPLSNYEFFYIIGLKSNSFISKRDVNKAYKQLLIKKRFSAVSIDLEDNGTGKKLHFTLATHWIFKKVEFEGIWFGKPKYATLYLQHPGDVFDIHLHEESLEAMKKYLHEGGYFSCSITDELVYSKKYKTLTAHIKVKKRGRFSVGKTTVVFTDQDLQKLFKKDELAKFVREVKYKLGVNIKGRYYSKKQLRKNIKKVKSYLQSRGFGNTNIMSTTSINAAKSIVDLAINIQLGKQKIITLSGNQVFTDEYIKDEFIGKDVPDWLFSPDIIAQQLLHEYYKKGYWQTKIKATKRPTQGYNFMITEGQPAFISTIEVIDSITHLPENASVILEELLKDKTCDQTVLDESFSRLKNFYISNGFWDFKIVDKNFEKNNQTGDYTIKITIEKGLRRLWAGFRIEDFPELEAHDFFKKYKAFSSTQQVPFNIHWIQEQRLFLLSHFQKCGYWYAEVEPHLNTISMPGSKVFLQWKIKPGSLVKFGKIIMRGATTVDFKRLERQCAFKQGSLWDREKIDRTRTKLKQLGVFKTIHIQPYQLSKNKSKKPIIMTLIDDDPVELRARLGYFFNSKSILFKPQSTPKVGASFIIKNPSNKADKLALVGDWTIFERKFCLDYQQPSPFGISAMGILKGYANKFIFPVQIRNSGSAYQALQCGFLAGLNEQYKQHYHWGINIGSEWLKITRVHGNLKLDPSLINRMLPYVFIQPNFEINKLDNPINTTKGSLTAVSVKMMIPETRGEFIAKLIAEQSLFLPLYKKIILAGHVKFGHIFRRTFDKILPIDRFYLGGPDSVRGYEPDALPPLGKSIGIINGKPVEQFTIQGGSSMFNTNLELRFPLYQSFGAVLFQDFGVLSQSGFAGFKERWYPGSGFGFRYKTPIGAIRFDIGWKWKKRLKEDTKYAWYLTLGEAF